MMALSEIKDTTGSKLNQYKITHADGTTEVVTLEFSPGEDYVPGTPFNAATVNPWLRKINNHDLAPLENITVPTSQFVDSADYPQYVYHVDIAVAGLLESDYCHVTLSPSTDEEGCIAKGRSLNGILRLYAIALPEESITISTLVIDRRGV